MQRNLHNRKHQIIEDNNLYKTKHNINRQTQILDANIHECKQKQPIL